MKTDLIHQGVDLAPCIRETEFKRLSLAENKLPNRQIFYPSFESWFFYSHLMSRFHGM